MSDPPFDRPRFCAQCGTAVVVPDASFCRQCGAPLTWLGRDVSWRPLLALCLSIIPGLGQLYKGQSGRGMLWFVFVILFLAYAMPIGILLWIICAGNAALSGAVREEVIAGSARRPILPIRRRPRSPIQPVSRAS